MIPKKQTHVSEQDIPFEITYTYNLQKLSHSIYNEHELKLQHYVH